MYKIDYCNTVGCNTKAEYSYYNEEDINQENPQYLCSYCADEMEIEEDKLYIHEQTETTIKQTKTHRGFGLIEFDDRNGAKCNIQYSSLATEEAIWFGIEDADPKIMRNKTPEGGTGWTKYDIPEDVLLTTRMHLSRTQVMQILPILQKFVETGELNNSDEADKKRVIS